ncbi:hypothetical protein NIE88_20805 [Sporolactobacillus shoreicorticis]|uniref:Major tropism determinant N-terminal domain-containing protein n=1 Tax=Sporolactobacillus shoreicorticis TaxID=1923877 RepID=A0ABW5S6Q7_9BACL|nr:hypothetical protein [Sporolactobacillus shoreicorticis]MCO7128187.1 hypothetical protein [Sporolactobacillus shoreicorticis]
MSYRPIQHYRGNEADLPQLMAGEIAVVTDTKKLFFGAGGNQEVARVGDAPTMTTATIDYYVALDGSDETGDGTESRPFKTIQHSFDTIPDFIQNRIRVILSEGTYLEVAVLRNKFGGAIVLDSPDDVLIKGGLLISKCMSAVQISHVSSARTDSASGIIDYGAIKSEGSLNVSFDSIKIDGTGISNQAGLNIVTSRASIINSQISNTDRALSCGINSSVYSGNNTGTGNKLGLWAERNTTIGKIGTQPAGTTAEYADGSSEIR